MCVQKTPCKIQSCLQIKYSYDFILISQLLVGACKSMFLMMIRVEPFLTFVFEVNLWSEHVFNDSLEHSKAAGRFSPFLSYFLL